jgi:hypothetical protein
MFLAVVCATGAWAEGETLTPLQRAERDLQLILNHLKNAQMRLEALAEGRPIDIGENSRAGDHPCCGWNVENIREGIAGVGPALVELRECHAAADAIESLTRVDVVGGELAEFARAVDLFASATTAEEAQGSFAAVTRTWIRLRTDAFRLEDCSATGGEPADGDARDDDGKRDRPSDADDGPPPDRSPR